MTGFIVSMRTDRPAPAALQYSTPGFLRFIVLLSIVSEGAQSYLGPTMPLVAMPAFLVYAMR